MLSFLMHYFVQGKAAWRMAAWSAYMIANTVTAGLIPIFFFAVLVAGDNPDRPDFWPRAGVFASGLVVGLCFVLFCATLVNRVIKRGQE